MPAPPNGQPDPRHLARLYTSLIPEAVLKSIGTGELNDRLTEAARLSAQANDPAVSPELRRAAKLRSQAVLRAQPRQATRTQHAELIRKAAAAPPLQAEAIRRRADRLIEEEHPIAPGRAAAVRKAKADADDTPVPVFDADGNLIGICKPGDITALTGTKQASAPDDSSQVAKAARAAGRTVVYDSRSRPYAVRAGNVQWPGGRVAKGAASGAHAPAARKTPGETRTGATGDRVVVKAAGWRDVHNRAGKLVGVIKAADVIKPGPEAERRARADAASFCNVFDAQGGRFGFAYRPNILPVRRGR